MQASSIKVGLSLCGAALLCFAGAGAGCSAEGSAPSGDGDAGTGGASTGGASLGGTSGAAGTASTTGGIGGSATTTGGTGAGGTPAGGTSSGGMTTGGTSGGATPTGGTGGSSTGGAAGAGATAGAAPTGGAGMGGRAGAGGGATGGSGTGGAAGGIYVGPSGNDSNNGSQASPFRTLGRAQQAVTAGQTIWMLPGTHTYNATTSLTKSGTQGAPIVIAASGTRPILDFASQPRGSNNRGIEIEGNYWQIRGLEIANAGDNCIAISGSNNVIENVVTHDCEDTGLQITVGASQAGNDMYGANNLILNCDSYQNFDQATGGENADGFAAKLRIGPGNVFRGCRAWNNADDGWDLFASNDVVTIDNCWAFANGKVNGQNPAGDGNGFKLGGAPNGTDQGGAVHIVTHNASFENRACGFTRNNNPQNPAASDCKVRDNPGGNYCAMSCSPMGGETMTAAQAAAAARNADGSLPAIQ